MIEVFGNVQITTQCMTECLKRGVSVVFYSTSGSYFGRLVSTNHVNVRRQRLQAAYDSDEAFKTAFSQKIICAKIKNQEVILRRYSRFRKISFEDEIHNMQIMRRKVLSAADVPQVMGYEGTAARIYFRSLGKIIGKQYSFEKRNRRPPLDPFNSLISLGYSVLLNEIYGKLEAKGLNPYFALMHKDREKHPALASDLMEEWRAVLIDSLSLNLLNRNELIPDDFYSRQDDPGVYLTGSGFKLFISKLEEKLRTKSSYLSYVDYDVSFRRAIELQVNQYVKMLETKDIDAYSPVTIR